MSFSINMPASARRHLLAADALPGERADVAGYLYGLAAECAVKALLLELGFKSTDNGDRKNNPLYQHFPALLTSSRDLAKGRKSATLARILDTPQFMANWEIQMRYAGPGEVPAGWVERWASNAKQSVGSIGT